MPVAAESELGYMCCSSLMWGILWSGD